MQCNAVAPLMRAMECIPEDMDGENANPLVSSIKSLNRGSMKAMKSDAAIQLQKLRKRLEDFWSRGWLSKKEYQQHLDFLSTFDVACIGSNGKSALRELEKEFDTMEEEKENPPPQSWSDMFMSTLGVSTGKKASSSAGLSSFWTNSMAVSTSDEDDEDEGSRRRSKPLATATNRTLNGATETPTIVSPRDLANILSEGTRSELFVETCFFARLGFVQPPCCMSCTYKEALKGSIPDTECSNWVFWRKNANRSFDPSNNANIGDNAVLVQCRSARKLVNGKTIEGYEWNSHQKMLLRRRS